MKRRETGSYCAALNLYGLNWNRRSEVGLKAHVHYMYTYINNVSVHLYVFEYIYVYISLISYTCINLHYLINFQQNTKK